MYVARVLAQRDRLQACLLEEVAEKYHNIHVMHGVSCVGVDLQGERPELELRPCKPVAGRRASRRGNKLFGIHVRATSESGGVATPYGTRVERGAYVGPALWG